MYVLLNIAFTFGGCSIIREANNLDGTDGLGTVTLIHTCTGSYLSVKVNELLCLVVIRICSSFCVGPEMWKRCVIADNINARPKNIGPDGPELICHFLQINFCTRSVGYVGLSAISK